MQCCILNYPCLLNQKYIITDQRFHLYLELIEILSLHKESFDIISFFELAISIHNDFCVINKMSAISKTYNAQINFFNRSFHIKIYENFNHIEVFAKYLQGFVYLTKNHVECITFQDLNNIFMDFSNFEKDSLLFHTGIYFANTNTKYCSISLCSISN